MQLTLKCLGRVTLAVHTISYTLHNYNFFFPLPHPQDVLCLFTRSCCSRTINRTFWLVEMTGQWPCTAGLNLWLLPVSYYPLPLSPFHCLHSILAFKGTVGTESGPSHFQNVKLFKLLNLSNLKGTKAPDHFCATLFLDTQFKGAVAFTTELSFALMYHIFFKNIILNCHILDTRRSDAKSGLQVRRLFFCFDSGRHTQNKKTIKIWIQFLWLPLNYLSTVSRCQIYDGGILERRTVEYWWGGQQNIIQEESRILDRKTEEY